MNKSIMLGVVFTAIAAMGIAGVLTAAANADINTSGSVNFKENRINKDIIITFPAGKAGKDGKNGQDGANGKDGLNGRDGLNGANGTDGAPGTNGLDGTNGVNGQDGANGQDGTNGTDGAPGLNGQDGKNGTDGATGRDGRNGTDGQNGVNGVDGRDGTMSLILNVTNGQHIVCSANADGNIGCIDTSEPEDNQTGGGTGTNETQPIQCQPNFHEENGACVENVVIPPIDNSTGNGTGTGDNSTIPIPSDNGTLPNDNGTTVFNNGTVVNENGTSTDINDTGPGPETNFTG